MSNLNAQLLDKNGNILFPQTIIEQITNLSNTLATFVPKVDGKGLSANDFTNTLLAKLNSLENYDDAELRNSISSLQTRLDTLVNGSASTAIDTFNEIVNFLSSISDTTTLAGIIAGINAAILEEKNMALAAETALQQNINTEKSSRESADTNLQNNLNAEITNRQNADTNLQTNITNEVNRAKLAEVNLCNDINVDKVYPLGSGYYTLATAIAAINDSTIKKSGISITFASASGIYDKYYFIGTVAQWNDTTLWINAKENPSIRYAKNNTGAAVTKGKLVYINGNTGENPLFVLATNTDYNIASRTWGMTFEDIPNNAVGRIIHFGLIENINTSSYAAGTELWLGTNGGITNVRPSSPVSQIYVGMVIRSSATVGSIFVDLRHISKFTSLSDVKNETYTDGDFPVFNGVNSRFEKQNIIPQSFYDVVFTNPSSKGIVPRRIGDTSVNSETFEVWESVATSNDPSSWVRKSAGKYGGTLITDFNAPNLSGISTALNTALNAPNNTENWYCLHMNSNNGVVYAIQIAVGFTTGKIYQRLKINSVYGSWIETHEQTRSQNLNTSPSSKLFDDELKMQDMKASGFKLYDNVSTLNYIEIPTLNVGDNVKITLLSGADVTVYTKENQGSTYIQQGILQNIGDSLILNTTNTINYVAIFNATGISRSVNVSYTDSLKELIYNNDTKINDILKYEINFIDGYFVVFYTGNILTASSYSYSDFIQVFSKKILVTAYFTDAAGLSFYDKNKVYISGFNRTTETLGTIVEVAVPTNAMYFRTSCLLANKSKFKINGNPDSNINTVCKKIAENSDSSISAISTNTTDILNLQIIDLGIIVDGFVNSVYGGFVSATSYKRTGYLRINATKIKTIITYQVASVGIAFYDKNKAYLSGFDYNNNQLGTEVTITVPSNAYYFATCAINAWAPSMRVRNINFANMLNKAYINIENPCFYNESKECATFKKILCVGDSLTEGRFEYKDGGTNVEYTDVGYSYPTFLKCLTGRDITNAGDAGETTKTWWEIHQNDNLQGHDACIIALGRNDYVVGRETTSAERIQYMTNIVNKVKADNPQIKIFISTMINYYTGTDADAVNADMRTIANTLSDCYLVDISTYGKMRMSIDNNSHCTAVGYQKLAGYYFNYISYIMSNNQSSFKNIQFAGTSNSYS